MRPLGATVTAAGRYGYPGFLIGLATNEVSLSYWDYQLRLDGGSGLLRSTNGEGRLTLDNGSGRIRGIYAQTNVAVKPIFEEWRGRLVTLGRRVRVNSGESTLEGVAESVERDGSLLLRQPDGGLTRIVAGDVTLREH